MMCPQVEDYLSEDPNLYCKQKMKGVNAYDE